jgi:hypothetical protein
MNDFSIVRDGLDERSAEEILSAEAVNFVSELHR